MTQRSFSPRRRASQALLALTLTAATVSTAACGNIWFGEEDDPLPGERVALRQATLGGADAPQGRAILPQAVSLAEWPQVGAGPTRAPLRVAGKLALERDWSRSIGSGSDSESRVTAEPILAGGRLFALDAAARVSAIDAASGDLIWRTDLTPEDEDGRDGFGGGLGFAAGKIVVSNGFGHVVGLDAGTGERLWTYKGVSPFRSPPAISQGLAVVVARSGELTAVDIETGEARWSVTNFEGGAAMLGGAGPAISGEVVAAPFSSGDIAIFRLRDGRRGWSETLGAPRRGSAMSLISDVSSAPIMSRGRIVAGGVSGRLVAFDAPTGQRVWARDIGVYNRAWAAGASLFVISEDARLYALSLDDGRSIWERQLPLFDDPDNRAEPFAYGGPILVGDALYLTSSEERLFEINAVTGEILREIDLPDASSIAPISAGGVLYVLDETGDLHAFR